jgi:nitrogen fixation NifU-like protein
LKDIISNSNFDHKKEALPSYPEKLIDHYKNPRNLGEMESPNALGEVRNNEYGDIIYVYLKIEKIDEKEVIKDIRFQTFGCAISIATSSVLTELIKGKPLNEAQRISKKDIAEALEIPINPMDHGINLAIKGLKNAIKNYYDNRY